MLIKSNTIKITFLLISWLLPIAISAQTPPRFQETEGIIIIEIESAPSYGSWKLDTAKVGYTGDGYLLYNGPDYFNSPGNSLLKFEIAIEKTGKYRFQWHSKIAVGDSNTDHNDNWLRFQDASDFYGEKDGQRVYPKGVGKTPNPNGSSADGWMKIYQNNRDNWTWVTRTSDNDPHEIFVEFDTMGIYTIEISGRSNGHAINRLALFHSDVNASTALDLARSESERIQTVAIKEVLVKALKIRPTLASQFIYFDLPSSIGSGAYEGQIINSLGQQIESFSFHANGKSEVALPIDQLEKGIYFVHFQKGSSYYQGSFVKQ